MPFTNEAASLLVVEDDPSIALILEEILTGKGHQVRVVHKPEPALAAIAESAPNLILMDINLGADMDGIETIRQIHAKYGEIPHCFITAYSQEDIVQRAEATEPLAYLVKPFEAGDVVAMVSIGLANARRRREQQRRAARLQLAVSHSQEPILFADSTGRLREANAAASALLGVESAELAGSALSSLLHAVDQDGGDQGEDLVHRALAAAESGRFQAFARLKRPDGILLPVQVNVSIDPAQTELVFRLRQVPNAVLLAAQRSARCVISPPEAQTPTNAPDRELEDPLTGLPNREAMEARFQHMLEVPDLFVAAIAVDHLLVMKQRFGGGAVDQILLAFSQHMAQHFPPGCLLARWSTSVFAAMPREEGDTEMQREIARVLSTPMLHHLQLTGRSALLRITASLAFLPLDSETAANLDSFSRRHGAK
jgi:PAS domain S-box-containing protein